MGNVTDNNTGIDVAPERNFNVIGNKITFSTRGTASHGILVGSGTYSFLVSNNEIYNAYWGLVIKGQQNTIRNNVCTATRALIVKGNSKLNNFYNNSLYSTGSPVSDDAYAIGLAPQTTDNATFTIDSSTDTFTSNSHGLSNGDQIYFGNVGGVLPGGLTASTNYYVVSKNTNTFQVSTTLGGVALDITSNGSGTNSWYVYNSDAKQIPMLNTFSNNIVDQGLSTNYALTNSSDGSLDVAGTVFSTFDRNLYYGATIADWSGTRTILNDLKNYWLGTLIPQMTRIPFFLILY